MKKLFFFALAAMTAVMTLNSCGSKSVAKSSEIENPDGAIVALSEPEQYALSKPGKRGYGMGQSQNENTARNIAVTQAQAQLARNISTKVEAAWDIFNEQVNQASNSNDEGGSVRDEQGTYREKMQALVKEQVASTSIVKVQKNFSKTRVWTYRVCVEYDESVADMAKKVAQKMQQRVSEQDRKKIEQHREQFEKEIEKKLNEM
jgi:hypothetical protein